ncbi:hypothetical protein EV361DRAFT_385538 [Lentinula raphanica]|uniref:Uncharacterized protein n=1 Tax=Lentinula raphanica TaxID=153919 RepID=A0AA38PAK2_9AGAR|nr:hypothetical protein F5878DRAFT_122282 [Lentinula raphanica]KAJ3976022.1 hypothetical protein EV361DRAFT_385538 [Lentinula raphanica]
MRSSLARSIQIISRNSPPSKAKINPSLHQVAQAAAKTVQPTVIDILMQRKVATGSVWPSNLRVEPVVKKEDLKDVHASIRPRLKQMLKET